MLQFDAIQFKSKTPKGIKRNDWGLSVPISSNWKKAKKRILFVVDHVPTADLKEKQLLSESTNPMFLNVIERGFDIANSWGKAFQKKGEKYKKEKLPKWGIGFINYNFFKTYDLSAQDQESANQAATKRLQSAIKKLKPTHVHFFGTSQRG